MRTLKKLTETLTKKLEKVKGMIKALENSSNKECESYTCLFSDSDKGRDIKKPISKGQVLNMGDTSRSRVNTLKHLLLRQRDSITRAFQQT